MERAGAEQVRNGIKGEFVMNNWALIKQHYSIFGPLIMAERSDEWAIDAYAWDRGFINFTPIESWLWQDIRQANVVMYPQWPVNGIFVDFANPRAKVAIECDGAGFHRDKEKDRVRDERLASIGWTVYRAPGWLCATEFDEEEKTISEARKFIDGICCQHRIKRGARP
jgi:very-short-patch-repair endonuclease